MEVRMVKRLAPADATVTPPDPRYLATAIEIVTRAGAIQQARVGDRRPVDKRTIDLVTRSTSRSSRCRALLAGRFPEHDILAEELGARGARGRSHRWVFDPLDGTTNFAHGVPMFCSALALEIDGEAVVGAVFDPDRAGAVHRRTRRRRRR